MDPAHPEPAPALEPSHDWFAAEIHPHEPALKAYLRGSFPTIRDVDDVVHESYVRILGRTAVKPVRSARGFLFSVARHLALDKVRKARRSPIDAVSDLSVIRESASPSEASPSLCRDEQVVLLAEAIDSLPRRCREVVILRKLRQLPQREVASRMKISEKGVEQQLARGIERCREYFRKRGLEEYFDREY